MGDSFSVTTTSSSQTQQQALLDNAVHSAAQPEAWQSEVELKVQSGQYNYYAEMQHAAGRFIDNFGTAQSLVDLRRLVFLTTFISSHSTQHLLEAHAASQPRTVGDEVAYRLNQFQSGLGATAYVGAHAVGADEEVARRALDAGVAVSSLLPLVAAGAGRVRHAGLADGRLPSGRSTPEKAVGNERFANARMVNVQPTVISAQNAEAQPAARSAPAIPTSSSATSLAGFELHDPAIWRRRSEDVLAFRPPTQQCSRAAAVNETELERLSMSDAESLPSEGPLRAMPQQNAANAQDGQVEAKPSNDTSEAAGDAKKGEPLGGSVFWTMPKLTDEQRELLRVNHKHVWSFAQRFARSNLPIDDIAGKALEGMIMALTTFDASLGFQFITHAKYRMHAHVSRSFPVENTGGMTTLPTRMVKETSTAENALRAEARKAGESGSPITDEAMASKLELTEKQWVAVRDEKRLFASAQVPLSTHTPLGTGSETSNAIVQDKLKTPEDWHPEADMSREQIASMVRTALTVLSEREREVIAGRFLREDGETTTLQEFGEPWGISRERVRKLQNRALEKLERALHNMFGITAESLKD